MPGFCCTCLDDAADPTTLLTSHEKYVIRQTWLVIEQDFETYAYNLWITFLTENPGYQSKFVAFKDVPVTDLRGNKFLLAHALKFLNAITAIVDNLDDPEYLGETLHTLGRIHNRFNVTYRMFERAGTSLVGSMTQTLGVEVMNETAQLAWQKAYDIIISVIKPDLERPLSRS